MNAWQGLYRFKDFPDPNMLRKRGKVFRRFISTTVKRFAVHKEVSELHPSSGAAPSSLLPIQLAQPYEHNHG